MSIMTSGITEAAISVRFAFLLITYFMLSGIVNGILLFQLHLNTLETLTLLYLVWALYSKADDLPIIPMNEKPCL